MLCFVRYIRSAWNTIAEASSDVDGLGKILVQGFCIVQGGLSGRQSRFRPNAFRPRSSTQPDGGHCDIIEVWGPTWPGILQRLMR